MSSEGLYIEGTVMEIVPKSGAIERCPKCRRALVNNHCPVHVDVESEKDLRIKAKLDSGEMIIINGERAENLLGVKIDEAHLLPEYDILNLIRGKVQGKKIGVSASPINGQERIFKALDLNVEG